MSFSDVVIIQPQAVIGSTLPVVPYILLPFPALFLLSAFSSPLKLNFFFLDIVKSRDRMYWSKPF